MTETAAPRTDLGGILDLDYRMVEWWNMAGTSYSLVQVVSRREADAAHREAVESLRAALRRSAEAAHDFALTDPDIGAEHAATPWTVCPAELCEAARTALAARPD